MNKNKLTCPVCNGSSKHSFVGNDMMFKKNTPFNYASCNYCESIFQYPLPNIKTISSFYPQNYTVYKRPKLKKISNFAKTLLAAKYNYLHLKNFSPLFYLAKLFPRNYETIPFLKNGKFLDVGCGNGARLLKMKSIGWNVEGVEFNKHAVKICKENELKVFHGTLEGANFKKNSFDVIYMSHLIEHLNKPLETVRSIADLLKENGRLYINTPNSNSIGRLLFRKFWFHNDVPRHVFLFNINSIKKIAEMSNLKVVYFGYKTSPKIILNSLGYFLGIDKPLKRNLILRFCAKFYLILVRLINRGDELFVILDKN